MDTLHKGDDVDDDGDNNNNNNNNNNNYPIRQCGLLLVLAISSLSFLNFPPMLD